MSKNWISVKVKQPPPDEPIVYCRPNPRRKNFSVGIAYWTVSKKWNPEMESKQAPEGFTHWMPLPAPPT
jgi:hypothetical protein